MKSLVKNIFRKKDELIGTWETTNDGGFQMLGGSRLIILPNGTGESRSWGHGFDEPYDFVEQLEWKRVGKKSIEIRLSENDKFDVIEYQISNHIGSYGNKFDKLLEPKFKLGETNMKGFWKIPGELFREKQN